MLDEGGMCLLDKGGMDLLDEGMMGLLNEGGMDLLDEGGMGLLNEDGIDLLDEGGMDLWLIKCCLVPPTSAPEITGGQEYYALGDILELNCTVHR